MFGALKNAFKSLKEKIIGKTISTQIESKEISEEPVVVLEPQLAENSELSVSTDNLNQQKMQNSPVLEKQDPKKEKVSIITKIKSAFSSFYNLSESDLNKIIDELEISFLQADLSVEVTEKLLIKIKEKIKTDGLPKDLALEESVKTIFIETIEGLLPKVYDKDFFVYPSIQPFVIMFVGANGTGKTTSISKLAYFLKENKKKVVLAASDTYRAASIEQLSGHAQKLGVDIIKGKYGQDPASVAFDAVAFAKAKNYDYVLIDTAGRQDTNLSLMQELAKIKKVANPDLVVFVSEAIAGQSAILQASKFYEITKFDAFALTKVDVDDKGGTLLSIAIGLEKPVLFLGVGQEYKDLEFFNIDFIKKII